LKLFAVFILGEGHEVIGLATILCAYAGSVFIVERLFKIVKPTLLELPWFAASYSACMSWWEKGRKWLIKLTEPYYAR
jgi:hypothetical protein